MHADEPLTCAVGDAGTEGTGAGAGKGEQHRASRDTPHGDQHDDDAHELAGADCGVGHLLQGYSASPRGRLITIKVRKARDTASGTMYEPASMSLTNKW